MAKKFSELRAKMAPESRARASDRTRQMLEAMPLAELRRARGLSQQMLAEVLHVNQPAIAKIEKRTDLYLSTLRSHIEAMGGELRLVARFPNGEVLIDGFARLPTDAEGEGSEQATINAARSQSTT
jgi:DNA-binding XRE family transcriptional regulator